MVTQAYCIGSKNHIIVTGKPHWKAGLRLSLEEASRFLRESGWSHAYVMAKNYGVDPDTCWVGLFDEDLDEDGLLDPEWGPFEIWEGGSSGWLTRIDRHERDSA